LVFSGLNAYAEFNTGSAAEAKRNLTDALRLLENAEASDLSVRAVQRFFEDNLDASFKFDREYARNELLPALERWLTQRIDSQHFSDYETNLAINICWKLADSWEAQQDFEFLKMIWQKASENSSVSSANKLQILKNLIGITNSDGSPFTLSEMLQIEKDFAIMLNNISAESKEKKIAPSAIYSLFDSTKCVIFDLSARLCTLRKKNNALAVLERGDKVLSGLDRDYNEKNYNERARISILGNFCMAWKLPGQPTLSKHKFEELVSTMDKEMHYLTKEKKIDGAVVYSWCNLVQLLVAKDRCADAAIKGHAFLYPMLQSPKVETQLKMEYFTMLLDVFCLAQAPSLDSKALSSLSDEALSLLKQAYADGKQKFDKDKASKFRDSFIATLHKNGADKDIPEFNKAFDRIVSSK
jgi:hypothetical protein